MNLTHLSDGEVEKGLTDFVRSERESLGPSLSQALILRIRELSAHFFQIMTSLSRN